MNSKEKSLAANATVAARAIRPLPNSRNTYEECAMEHKHGSEANVQHAQQHGLYNHANEHDACGIGFIAHIRGHKSHSIVAQGLLNMKNLAHRGAVGADKLMGDGAGILIQLPDQFYREEMANKVSPFITEIIADHDIVFWRDRRQNRAERGVKIERLMGSGKGTFLIRDSSELRIAEKVAQKLRPTAY
jgi:glutamate synthase domain-containing protein 1